MSRLAKILAAAALCSGWLPNLAEAQPIGTGNACLALSFYQPQANHLPGESGSQLATNITLRPYARQHNDSLTVTVQKLLNSGHWTPFTVESPKLMKTGPSPNGSVDYIWHAHTPLVPPYPQLRLTVTFHGTCFGRQYSEYLQQQFLATSVVAS